MQETTAKENAFSWKAEMRLIRWPNIVIMIFIQVTGFFVYTQPAWPHSSSEGYRFLMQLILMTSIAATSGYYINDLLDRDADRHNGRKNVLNTGEISPKLVRRNYILGIAIGLLFSINLTKWSFHFLWIYAVVTLLLWLYSKYLKRLPLIGNLVVSFFCAGVVLILWTPVHPIAKMPGELWVLAAFAFLITLIREIVKDIEDQYGDSQAGDLTLPIVLGTYATKFVVIILLITCVVGLLLPQVRASFKDPIVFIFWLGTQALLLFVEMYFILKAKEKSHYHFVSTLLKVAMLTGTLFIVL